MKAVKHTFLVVLLIMVLKVPLTFQLNCCLSCRPFWLSPTQAIVIPVSPKYEEYANKVTREWVARFIYAAHTDIIGHVHYPDDLDKKRERKMQRCRAEYTVTKKLHDLVLFVILNVLLMKNRTTSS